MQYVNVRLQVREAALKQAEALGKEVDTFTQGQWSMYIRKSSVCMHIHVRVLIVVSSCPVALQVEGEMKYCPLSTPADSDPPKESLAPVLTAYADGYFEGDFAAPFSDLEEEEGEESTSSGSSETASLEDNPSVTEEKPPQIEITIQPEMTKCVDGSDGGQLSEGQQRHLFPKSVESESPLSISSTGSPEHSSSTGGSQVERLVSLLFLRNTACMYQ